MDTRPRVICGFPGVGKTTLFKQLKDQGVLITDSDSSQFDKAHFPGNYIAHIQQRLAEGFWVLCSTHQVVRDALHQAGIAYVIVAPVHAYLKDEYMQRYRERGSPEPFLKLMDEKFEDFVKDVWADKVGIHFGLGEGEYMGDRFAKDLLKSDQGMKHMVFQEPELPDAKLRVGQPYYSTEFMGGFHAGIIWQELLDGKKAGWTDPKETFIKFVRKADTRIYIDMAQTLALELEIKATMNPQAVELIFRPRTVVAA